LWDSMISVSRQKMFFQAFTMILTALLFCGCGAQQLTVKGEYPGSLVESLPVTIGLVLTPEFLAYQYHYQPKSFRETELIMDTGISQSLMLNTVTASMFEQVITLRELPTAGNMPPVDVLLIPTIEKFEHAIPRYTKVNVFEIWIKYRFQLITKKGELIADWYMSAYGKTPSQFMDSAEDSLNLAAVIAFRDAGANFSLNFARIPEVKQWLAKQRTLQTETKP
jgi:hypothetical protein